MSLPRPGSLDGRASAPREAGKCWGPGTLDGVVVLMPFGVMSNMDGVVFILGTKGGYPKSPLDPGGTSPSANVTLWLTWVIGGSGVDLRA
jgi:hypothetical protein